VVIHLYLGKTRSGLNLRAVGENPGTADAAGINVTRYKYLGTCIGAGISGLGGLYYVMDYTMGTWANDGTIESLGWLAVALVIFASWNPALAILGTFVFGFFNTLRVSGSSLAMAFPGALGWLAGVPTQVYQALPFVITAIVLVVSSIRDKKGSGQPGALGVNYFREDR
jgi:simple sugar transport system permease protein